MNYMQNAAIQAVKSPPQRAAGRRIETKLAPHTGQTRKDRSAINM